MTVFYDDEAILFDDSEHSSEEERFLIIGISRQEKLCIVNHCYRGDGNMIRITSARKATKNEMRMYNRYAGGVVNERGIRHTVSDGLCKE